MFMRIRSQEGNIIRRWRRRGSWSTRGVRVPTKGIGVANNMYARIWERCQRAEGVSGDVEWDINGGERLVKHR
jgi:hypothetical protein